MTTRRSQAALRQEAKDLCLAVDYVARHAQQSGFTLAARLLEVAGAMISEDKRLIARPKGRKTDERSSTA
ncbi:hypothetical protein [Magnetospirillum moscoviense]|uniref:Uncharacterized protein n=1 Tax=Magnetospirillum moscoviense TaxID=1437059 RepID=A0A178MJQ8_9PROT|nr:hypothetical protein [Magnetospirillum moscoviense]MBF0325597.1 hypothetical protein [Alphaproteobacteria bacterium]OAN48972.1 hypothetical protein A6A05_03020 [Magnetospirillum moscoviense]